MRSRRALAGALGAIALLLAPAAAAATGARSLLLHAVERTSAASSLTLVVDEHVDAGGQREHIRLNGTEQPHAGSGSFSLELTPALPGLGQASELEQGSHIYVHYAILATLHARNPRVKHWIVVNSSADLGVNPAGLASLDARELAELKGVRSLGRVAGTTLTRYTGSLDLRAASRLPQIEQLFAHLPAEAAGVLTGTDSLVYTVGADGYVHAVSMTLATRIAGEPLTIALTMALSGFDRRAPALAAPPADDVMTLQQFEALLGVGPTPAETALVHTVVLRPAQVGSGYVLAQVPGGQLVQGEPTLDFCGFSYPSETLRRARLQVVYAAKGTGFTASNEVVAYTTGGAQEALGEMRKAAVACPDGPVARPPSGVSDLVRRTQVLHPAGLLPGSVVILQTETGLVRGRRVQEDTVAIYQVRANILSGVYGYGSSVPLVRTETLRAALASAGNLRHDVRPSPAQTGLTA